jgi:pyruvate dehydrogenase E2 component (dihydrolipoamide acetyltransferase)
MAFEFKLPDLGEGLTEAEIVKWLVQTGDPIAEGQIFVQVETDKAVIDIPSPRKGVVLKLTAAEGEMVQVGAVIIIIGDAGEKVKIPSTPKAVTAAKRPSVGVVGELEEAPEYDEAEAKVEKIIPESIPILKKDEILAVPMVRKLARDLNVDLRTIQGSGPHGRITKEDIEKAAQRKKPAGKPIPEAAIAEVRKYDFYGFIEKVPLKGMRKAIAQAMAKSKSTIPHACGLDEADMTQLIALKAKAKERASQKKIHLTFLPFVIKAVVAALEEHPYVNASFDEESGEIILKKYYNIGVAVDTKDGLMVPVVKNTKDKNIFQLAAELAELSEKARLRTIDLKDLKGGTFTITNFGAMGGIYGFPIIHYPEVAIIGMGKIYDKPIVVDGKIEIRKVLPLSLSFDHRVIDGAEAVRFMNTVIELLEDPGLILMEE